MARVAVIGEGPRVRGFALAGALVLPAEGPTEIDAAWDGLPPDVVVAVLTPAAGEHLREHLTGPGTRVLPVVMPP